MSRFGLTPTRNFSNELIGVIIKVCLPTNALMIGKHTHLHLGPLMPWHCSTPLPPVFSRLMRRMMSTGERPAFPLDCRLCHGFFPPTGLVLWRPTVATFSRPWPALACGHGTSWDDVCSTLGARHGCSPVTPRWAHPSSFHGSLPPYLCHHQRCRLFCRCSPWPLRCPQRQ